MEEIWKDIPGYEGLYQVSNLGRIKSLPKEWFSGLNTVRKHNGKILKPGVNQDGYFSICLYKNKLSNSKKIHHLVALVFLNHKTDGTTNLVIDHIDNNKKNNCIDNLQIITHRKNISKDKKNKTSKYTGVYWVKGRNKWMSRIYINGKEKYLGCFLNEYDAHLKYQEALQNIK